MSLAKTIGGASGTLRALPHLALYALSRPVLGPEHAMMAASERIARLPGYTGLYARRAFYRRILEHVGNDVHFGFMSLFSKSGARIGDRVYVGRFCTVGWAKIGDDVRLADGVQILSGRHQHLPKRDAGSDDEASKDDEQVYFEQVSIGDGAWLGAGAIVMADVGNGAIIGAGAVVTKPVAPGARMAGVPARAMGRAGDARAFT
ncbi:MAG: acetyltransferase [Phycisphaeraceae bacterium]|nr:acetyltransferase [Phycisphaeraceae bacterium]